MANTKYGRNGGEYAGGYYRKAYPLGYWQLWATIESYSRGDKPTWVLCEPMKVSDVRATLKLYIERGNHE